MTPISFSVLCVARLKLLQPHVALVPLGLTPAACSGIADVLRTCPLRDRPAFFGCCGPLLRSPWFQLYLYHALSGGPPSLLVPRGCLVTRLPDQFKVTSWRAG